MISREQVLKFLKEKQESNGGYTGNDLTKLAELLNVTSFGLRRRLTIWIQTDKEFSHFIYLGKEKPPINLFEFFKIEQELESNPIRVKKEMFEDIQEERIEKNQEPLAKSTFYRGITQKILSMFGSERNNWFKTKQITFPENYSVEKNRELLQTIFTFSDMKTYGGADIDAILQRLVKAKEIFSVYEIDANRYYPEILTRRKILNKLLSSIPQNQQLEIQAKLIFQIQNSFIIECTDMLINELISKQGRIRQSDNASRQKVENKLRKGALGEFRKEFKDVDDSAKIDAKDIKRHANVLVEEEILARIKLLKENADEYRKILKLFNDITNDMTTGVKFQRNESRTIYKIAAEEITWDKLNEQGKMSIVKKPDLLKAINHGNAEIVPLIAINRLIDHIRKGKITFDNSYYFQDIGERDCRINPLIFPISS
jgi:hypothetical protein